MEPRPLLELNVQQAIASILQKRQWWVKWQDAELRRKWLDEIEPQLLQQSFAQTLVGWEHGCTPLNKLNELLQQTSEPEASNNRKEWLQNIVTELSFDRDDDDDDDDDGIDDDDEEESDEEEEEGLDGQEGTSERSPEERALAKKVAGLESYAQVKWTWNRLLLHEKLRALPVETWTTENTRDAVASARELCDPTLDSRGIEFLLAVRSGVDVHTALHLPVDSAVLDETRLTMLKMHCEKIHRELEAVRNYITKVIDQIADNEGLSASLRPDETAMSPAGIDGVWISDNLVSEVTATALMKEVARLENVADEQKDWHPNSNKQVLDLVHPSLFCCVFGQTMRVAAALDPTSFTTPAEQMVRLMSGGVEKVKKPRDCNTAYQWIPTDFLVQEAEGGGGSGVRILSYINNLHPEQHEPLYDSIGKIFGHFVPLFERMLSFRADSPPRPAFRVDMYEFEPGHALPRRPAIPDAEKLPKQPITVSLKGKTLQAIVKIAEIVLTPENPQYAGGAWHMEGTDAEKIVGTGIYYFACENIKDSRLSFRAEVEQPPYQQNDNDGVAAIFGLFNEKLLVQVLGAVQTTEGRCVAFPNSHQHQVQPFELEDPSKPGVRKILAFFLVDPENPVPSTSVIPPQQQEWIEMTQQPMIKKLKLVETVEDTVRSMLRSGMSMEEAKEHRLQLMAERAAPDDNHVADMERYFSLCEH